MGIGRIISEGRKRTKIWIVVFCSFEASVCQLGKYNLPRYNWCTAADGRIRIMVTIDDTILPKDDIAIKYQYCQTMIVIPM